MLLNVPLSPNIIVSFFVILGLSQLTPGKKHGDLGNNGTLFSMVFFLKTYITSVIYIYQIK